MVVIVWGIGDCGMYLTWLVLIEICLCVKLLDIKFFVFLAVDVGGAFGDNFDTEACENGIRVGII